MTMSASVMLASETDSSLSTLVKVYILVGLRLDCNIVEGLRCEGNFRCQYKILSSKIKNMYFSPRAGEDQITPI